VTAPQSDKKEIPAVNDNGTAIAKSRSSASHKRNQANKYDIPETTVKRRSAMNVTPGFSTAFRVLRGTSGLWEVMQEGCSRALARFEAPQAALSYACSIAEARNGALVVVFDKPRQMKSKSMTRPARGYGRAAQASGSAFAGQAS
jgi:hypothetical protein